MLLKDDPSGCGQKKKHTRFWQTQTLTLFYLTNTQDIIHIYIWLLLGHAWQGTRISQAIILSCLGNKSLSARNIHQLSFTFIWLHHGHYHSNVTQFALRSKAGWGKIPAARKGQGLSKHITQRQSWNGVQPEFIKMLQRVSDTQVTINNILTGQSQEVSGKQSVVVFLASIYLGTTTWGYNRHHSCKTNAVTEETQSFAT